MGLDHFTLIHRELQYGKCRKSTIIYDAMSFGGQEKMIRLLSSENQQIWKWCDRENIYTCCWLILTKNLISQIWWIWNGEKFPPKKKMVDQIFSPLLGKSKKKWWGALHLTVELGYWLIYTDSVSAIHLEMTRVHSIY